MGEYGEAGSRNNAGPEKIDLTKYLGDFGQGIKKFWWLVIGLAVVFAAQAFFSVSYSYVPTYVASATMSVRSAGTTASYVNAQTAEQMAEVFPYILTSGVLKNVIAEDMGVESVPGSISVTADEGTNLLTLSVTSGDPEQAYAVLQSVIKNYPKVAEFVIGQTELTILDETGVPEDTGREQVIRGSYRRGAMKGAVIGLMIMMFYIVTRRTVKSRKEVKRAVNLEDYGTIPFVAEKKRKKSKVSSTVSLLSEQVPQSYLEAIRKLRIKVMREMESGNHKSLLITSSIPGEGKTTLSINLAIAAAKQGRKVILVDADPRNPSVARGMNEEGEYPGLGQVLRGKVTIEEALKEVEVPDGKMQVLFGGKASERDSKLLGTKAMEALLAELEKRADIVILDTAPSELLADAPAVGKFVDAALYIVKYDCAKKRQIRNGVQALAMSGVKILGFAFNADKAGNNRGANYGYSYGYGKRSDYSRYGNYGHYGHYGRSGNGGESADAYGRVYKE